MLDEIRAEILPLRMPAELERFWRLVDPGSITLAPYPHPMTAAFALQSWRMHRDEAPGMTPSALFPFAYESHGFLFVELEDGRGHGDLVVEWGYGGSPFVVRFPALSAYVDLLATMIERGEFAHHERYGHSWTEFDPARRWQGEQIDRLGTLGLLPGTGLVREIDEDARAWPEHWLLSNGLTVEARTPRGATTTVAALLRAAAEGDAASGTIRATVARLVGSGGGRRIDVDDGSGVLDVWCPTDVCAYGPVIGREFELDVVLRPAAPAAPDWSSEQREIQQQALEQNLESAQEAIVRLYAKAFQTPATAEATGVRPVD
ncbi:hypothetical protein [Cellulomonas sp. KRMCY2]|uniref:hypothetical protein n=1 Tax=Cellulomonas sp. KRMCY2 TaxID=1304865 RepID=UPI0012DED7DC|nr:hypothetical protein [Cellulomonas sp. KRMCY2]